MTMGCCESSAKVSSAKINGRVLPDYLDTFNGPVRNRSCTDTLFFLLFLAYVIFMVVVVVIAAFRGDPRRLLYGYDDYGNICGIQNSPIVGGNNSGINKKDFKYLLIEVCSDEKCNVKKSCQKQCPEGYHPTILRRCVPQSVASANKSTFKFAVTWFEEIGSDITLCWPQIALLCFISLGLSLVLLVVFRFFAGIIIWFVLGVVTIASIAITIYIWVMWSQKKKELENTKDNPSEDRELKEKQLTYWLAAAIIATIFTVIYLLIVIFMRNRIKLVAALFKEAGKAVSAMPFILLQPVWTFIMEALACFFLLIGFLYVQTAGTPNIDGKGYVTFPLSTFFQVMRWLGMFLFLWLTQFILACQHLVIAGAVSYWYFTRDKAKLRSPILKSLRNLILYHMGSAALGSLIIAIMKAIRALFRLLEKYLNSRGQQCQIFWKIFQCCLACFESYLKFLSRNAYIMIATFGEPFCASARRAFSLLAANIARVAAINCIGDFILFVGKVGVTVAVTFIGIEIIKTVEGVNYLWVPVALSSFFAFICSHCFLSVYEMAIDTLLLCFCEDCERNDGITKPYFMSRSLMIMVEKSRNNANARATVKGMAFSK